MDSTVAKGCDGIEPDNVDGYANDSGFLLNYQDQLLFNKWLADQAHKSGLSIGMKNDLEQVDDLVAYSDWALNEECFAYNKCEYLLPFIEADKAVFGVEYSGELQDFCPATLSMNFDWLKKNLNLDGWRASCG